MQLKLSTSDDIGLPPHGVHGVNALIMPVFGKKETCPTSVELLAFRHSEADAKRVANIRWHLTFCDFSAAELELYIHFPPNDDEAEPSPIPKHLFDLAESILKRKPILLNAEAGKSRSR